MRRRSAILLLASTALIAGCSGDPSGTKPTSQLHFLRLAATAPALANATDSFWAKQTANSEIRIYFHAAVAGATDSMQLLALQVPKQALWKRPDGTLYGADDSVLIHVTVSNPANMVVAFEPAGLQFSSSAPAILTFEFGEADNDVNNDGVVDATDDLLKAQLHLWRQETSSAPWTQLPTIVNLSSEDAIAEILGFTNSALAY